MERVKKKSTEKQIHDENSHGRLNERGNRRAADARRTAFHTQTLIATYCRDDESENNRLREAYTEVAKDQRMDGASPEHLRTKVQC
jgi:hypothetical protein